MSHTTSCINVRLNKTIMLILQFINWILILYHNKFKNELNCKLEFT